MLLCSIAGVVCCCKYLCLLCDDLVRFQVTTDAGFALVAEHRPAQVISLRMMALQPLALVNSAC